MHKVVEKIKENIHIPILHIADATAKEIKRKIFKQLVCLELNIQWSKISISHVLKRII